MPKELKWIIDRNISKKTQWAYFWNYALYNKSSKTYKLSIGGVGVWRDEETGNYTVDMYDKRDISVYESDPMTYAEAMKQAKYIRDTVETLDEFNERREELWEKQWD